MPDLRPAALGLALLVVQTACLPKHLSDLPAQAIDESLAVLSEPEHLDEVRAILEGTAVPETGALLAEAVTGGVMDGLTEAERSEVLRLRTTQFVEALAPALAAAVGEELGPAFRAELVAGLDESLRVVARRRGDAAAVAGAVTASVTSALAQTASTELAERLAPALEVALRDHLAPGVARSMDDHLTGAVSRAAREVTRETLLGVADAMDGELGVVLSAQRQLIKEDFKEVLGKDSPFADWLRWVGWGVAGLVGLGGGWLCFVFRREKERCRAALELVTASIHRAHYDPGVADTEAILALVREKGQDTDAGAYLSAFLKDKKHFKVEETAE